MGSSEDAKEKARATVRRIRDGLRITKITCTRSIKSRSGDSFVGFSAAWQSVQDDVAAEVSDEDGTALVSQGLSLKDARVARCLLSLEVDLAALDAALANGSISPKYFAETTAAVRTNHQRVLTQLLTGSSNRETES